MSVADRARLADDPYAFSIARFVLRMRDRDARTITFIFDDDSTLVFNVRYEVAQ